MVGCGSAQRAGLLNAQGDVAGSSCADELLVEQEQASLGLVVGLWEGEAGGERRSITAATWCGGVSGTRTDTCHREDKRHEQGAQGAKSTLPHHHHSPVIRA